MVVVRSRFFSILVPGTVAGVLPWLLLQSSGEAVRLVPSIWLIGLLPLLAGLVLFFWCNGFFTFVGKGTLAPIDAPIFLVRAGPYQFADQGNAHTYRWFWEWCAEKPPHPSLERYSHSSRAGMFLKRQNPRHRAA